MGRLRIRPCASLALVLLALCLMSACAGKVAQKGPVKEEGVEVLRAGGPHLGETIKKLMEVEASTGKGSYLPGEDMAVELSLKNVSSEPIQMDPYPPDVRIMRPRTLWDEVRLFPAGTGTRSLDPGEAAMYAVTWDQRDGQGQQVAYGLYKLVVGPIHLGDVSLTRDFWDSLQLLILPAEGTMEKSIELNESRTVNGITIILQRLELTTLSAAFYAFNVPPDYTMPQVPFVPGSDPKLSQGRDPAPPWMMELHARAEYCLDGGLMKDAGLSGIGFVEDGMRHSWIMLDPVPKGTRELTFSITELGDWDGPWEFQVLLE